jgi:hypothetical protein
MIMGAWHVSDALEGLVRRIRDGEVVFFVGAGFSIDSEKVSAHRVMQRLLLRLSALDRLQKPAEAGQLTAFRQFAGTFDVKPTLGEIAANWSDKDRRGASDMDRLAFRYYEVNEWMCRRYGRLLKDATPPSYEAFRTRLAAAEQAGRAESGWSTEVFGEVPATLWTEVRKPEADLDELGKLLFVETLGFFDHEVMAGPPFEDMGKLGGAALEARYGDRLKPRHHVLARLAREGLCPVLLTTNFDLLLEGALRLAGFETAPEGVGGGAGEGAGVEGVGDAPLTAIPWFDVIASPQAFFARGKAWRTATLLKIHGCAGFLRKREQDFEGQRSYLRQLIYTYREIQHWRDDSWAADYLRTLLRTRTMVLAGYSTADPVMHDTFRGIYEEMERKLEENAQAPGGPTARATPVESTPAYFLAYSARDDIREFHGDEVLRAASRGVGAKVPDGDHPQYLRFAPSWEAQAARMQLDELLVWVQHRLLRAQQAEALRMELPALIARLDRRRPRDECDHILKEFEALAERERREVLEATGPEAARRALRSMAGWSGGFHVALRREWARALVLGRHPGRREAVAALEHRLWYFPANERPAWTAWSAVLELALRRLGDWATRYWNRASSPFPREMEEEWAGLEAVQPALALRPTVFFRQRPRATSPVVALTIQLRGFDRPGRPPAVPGAPARRVVWLMQEEDLPWTNRTEEAGVYRPGSTSGWFFPGPKWSGKWRWERGWGPGW